MFNVGGGELLVILFVALVVLGPEKLPEVARKLGNFMGEVRRMSNGFQDEFRSALDAPSKATQAARDTLSTTSPTTPADAPATPSTGAPAAVEPLGPVTDDDDIRPIDPTGDRHVVERSRPDDSAA